MKAAMKSSPSAPKVAKTPSRAASKPKGSPGSAAKLGDPRKAGPTKETPPRCELTAYDDNGKRVHVFIALILTIHVRHDRTEAS